MPYNTITLKDEATGSFAQILPEFGFNCYRFQAVADGEPVEVLWSDPDILSGNVRPSGSGIPLLFPFPGRLRGSQWSYAGKQGEIPAGDGRANAIHGFVLNRAWEVLEQKPQEVTARFLASKQAPEVLKLWPADFQLTVTYRLEGNCLSGKFLAENPDTKPLPWGLGMHPYFSMPLGPGGSAETTRVQVPAARYLVLDEMLPTGEILPATGSRDLAAGLPFPETELDDIFTDLKFADHQCTSTLADTKTGRILEISFDQGFPYAVVYNPGHRQAICVEPYSCVPSRSSDLAESLNVLAPGESFTGTMTIDLR